MRLQSLFLMVLGIWHRFISDIWRRAFSASVPLAMMIVLRVLLIVFYYRSLGGFLIGSLDAFVQVSIHNPEGRPQFYGKTFGKTFGKGILHPFEQRKRKAEPLVFQRDSAICENFSKILCFPEKIPCSLSNVYANAYLVGQTDHILNEYLHQRHRHHRSCAQGQP